MITALVFLLASTAAQANGAFDCGRASWYGPGFHGNKTASGERFNQNDLTAASKTLPFGTVIWVENQSNGKKVQVKVNDRGPFNSKIIDLSAAAASAIGMKSQGVGSVCLYN